MWKKLINIYYTMDKVADPAPSFALTTSSPPNWMRWVSASISAVVNLAPFTWESSGKIVVPACPPITVTFVVLTSNFWFSETNALALTTSKVVTPNTLRGL